MENYIFNCYKKWLEEEEGDLFKQIFKIPVMARVLFILLLAGLILFCIILGRSIYGKNDTILTLFLSFVYTALCIIFSIYTEKYQVKHSRDGLKNYKKYCKDMKDAVLTENDISEKIIPALIEKYQTMNNSIDEKIRQSHEHIHKFMEMLLIPISASILGALLNKSVNASEILSFGLSGTVIILIIYASIFLVLFVYDISMKFSQEKYKQFITDLQSILDFKRYEIASESEDDVATSFSTQVTPGSPSVHT